DPRTWQAGHPARRGRRDPLGHRATLARVPRAPASRSRGRTCPRRRRSAPRGGPPSDRSGRAFDRLEETLELLQVLASLVSIEAARDVDGEWPGDLDR